MGEGLRVRGDRWDDYGRRLWWTIWDRDALRDGAGCWRRRDALRDGAGCWRRRALGFARKSAINPPRPFAFWVLGPLGEGLRHEKLMAEG